MCAQCTTTGAVVATAAATGARVWLAARAPAWLTRRLLGLVSAAVLVAGIVAAGLATA